MPVGAPALGGGGSGADVGSDADARGHPGGVVQGGVEKAAGDGEPQWMVRRVRATSVIVWPDPTATSHVWLPTTRFGWWGAIQGRLTPDVASMTAWRPPMPLGKGLDFKKK